jgi:hypothetical protein
MTKICNGIDELAQELLSDLNTRRDGTIEITAKDASDGGLLLLVLALHEAAGERKVRLEVSAPADNQLRICLPSGRGPS